jgi:hypothetical protein
MMPSGRLPDPGATTPALTAGPPVGLKFAE